MSNLFNSSTHTDQYNIFIAPHLHTFSQSFIQTIILHLLFHYHYISLQLLTAKYPVLICYSRPFNTSHFPRKFLAWLIYRLIDPYNLHQTWSALSSVSQTIDAYLVRRTFLLSHYSTHFIFLCVHTWVGKSKGNLLQFIYLYMS